MGPGPDFMGPLVTFFVLALCAAVGVGVLIGWLLS